MASTRQNVSEIISAAAVACAEIEQQLERGMNADTLLIVSIQSNMIKAIGLEYSVAIDLAGSAELLKILSARMRDRLVHSSRHTMLGWLPGIENVASESETAGFTEALGWAANSHFELLNTR